jgi:inner membrane protein
MEPITHILTGACLGRAGLNRKTAYATLVAAVAAEVADSDELWSLAGPVEELKRHRGITHTLLAAPLLAAAVVGCVWLYERWRKDRASAPNQKVKVPPAPVRWGWLYATALLATLSHLLLDWTNNYGVRPFFPFNPRWYAGSFVYIGEPVLWLLLGLAFALPWLLGLVDGEIGVRRKPFRGQGWAIFALTGMVALWGLRWTEASEARALVEHQQLGAEPALRVAVEPYPVNPFRWHAIEETNSTWQTAEVDTLRNQVESDPLADRIPKPEWTDAIRTAEQTPLGQAYMDWGRWAVVRDLGPQPVEGLETPQLVPGRRWTTVQFTDLRFGYSYLGRGGPVKQAPLTAWVMVVDGREEAGQTLGHRVQR